MIEDKRLRNEEKRRDQPERVSQESVILEEMNEIARMTEILREGKTEADVRMHQRMLLRGLVEDMEMTEEATTEEEYQREKTLFLRQAVENMVEETREILTLVLEVGVGTTQAEEWPVKVKE